jgi:hypothetical protein
MGLVNATFIVNNNTNKEIFVKDLPSNYHFAPGERLVTRQISQADYNLFLNDKYKHVKLYRYIDQNENHDRKIPPKGLDYKIGLTTRLYEDAYVNNNGFLQRMDFYGSATFNPTTKAWNFSDKIITEDYNYTIDPATKYVVARTKIVKWYREDGTVHPETKIMFKPYTFLEMDEEAIRRRSNIITGVKIELSKFANFVVSQQFPNANQRPDSNEVVKRISAPLNTAIRSYIDAGDKDTLTNLLNNSTEPFFNFTIPWLGMTPRQLAISRIS